MSLKRSCSSPASGAILGPSPIQNASENLGPCSDCGNLTEHEKCSICMDEERDESTICIVESVTDLYAMERSGVFRGKYHVLQGKLSPIRGVGPEQLNFSSLSKRLENDLLKEINLALGRYRESLRNLDFAINLHPFIGIKNLRPILLDLIKKSQV